MILSHGLNVKVVLFPDGQDPDSYAKKHSDSEVKNYITENAKDFIVFKSDVLLKEAKGDPIKKAELIRDIVSSIALIPDSIKQQIYLRECAGMFSMDEQLLSNELAKLKRAKLLKDDQQNRFKQNREKQLHSSIQEPPPEALIPEEYLTTEQKEKLENYKKQSPGLKGKATVHTRLYHQEKDIVRILLNFGKYAIKVNQIVLDERGNETLKPVDVNVVEYIINELKIDQIEFENTLFQEVIDIFDKALKDENKILSDTDFVRHPKTDISKLAVDIIADNYELSPDWHKLKVKINTEIENLERSVTEAIYSFKLTWVLNEIDKLQEEIEILAEDSEKNIDDILSIMAQQKKLDQVKNAFSEKLGRRII